MTQNKKVKISLLMNLIIFILEVIGGYLYLVRSGLDFVQFYTEDSNTIAMIACLCMAAAEYKMLKSGSTVLPAWIILLKYLSALGLTLTFIVVIFILIPLQGGGSAVQFLLLDGSMLYHHLLCPILTFISFLYFDPIGELQKKDTLIILVPTAVYAGVMIVLNLVHAIDGPYPFLRVYQQPFYMSCLWVAVILGSAYLIASLYRLSLHRKSR